MKFKQPKKQAKDGVVINFEPQDYVLFKLNSDGKERPVHKYLAERLEKNGKGKIVKGDVGVRDEKGVATVVNVN